MSAVNAAHGAPSVSSVSCVMRDETDAQVLRQIDGQMSDEYIDAVAVVHSDTIEEQFPLWKFCTDVSEAGKLEDIVSRFFKIGMYGGYPIYRQEGGRKWFMYVELTGKFKGWVVSSDIGATDATKVAWAQITPGQPYPTLFHLPYYCSQPNHMVTGLRSLGS